MFWSVLSPARSTACIAPPPISISSPTYILSKFIPLLAALQENFYVDEHAVREAIDRRQSFNAIHFDSVFKVDIFIPKSDEFSRKQIERRELRKLAPDVEQMVYVATAEDTILAKLRWYNSGGRVSNTQWTDVVGIIGGSSSRLDLDYLRALG